MGAMRPMSFAAWVVAFALAVGAAAAQGPAETEAPAPAPEVSAVPETHTKAVAPSRRASTHRSARHARPSRHTSRHAASHAAARPAEPGDGTSLSIGRHNRGRLLRAHQLTESPTLRFKTPHSEAHFGTDELVGLLERASQAVAARSPGARLTVGDLSRRGGGRFRPHRSHQSGRDADVGFYVVDGEGATLDLDRFFDFRRDMTVRNHDALHWDLARNWQLVEALVSDEVPVQWIFVSRPLRAHLFEEAARQGASAEVIEHAQAILEQPSHGGVHNDHFHVRIFCPASDHPRCLDDPPIHPWMPGAPAVAPTAAAAAAEAD